MIEPRTVLQILIDLTCDAPDDRPLEDSLERITDAALRLLPGDHASVRLLDDTRTELIAGARSGSGSSARPLVFRRGEGIAGWVVEQGRAARIDDAPADPRFRAGRNQGFEVCAILAMPLWSAGKVIGVLAVSSPRPGVFSPDDEAIARLLANCAVAPIEKARLARLAVTDPGTMAFNPRYLLPRLGEEIERAHRQVLPLSVLLMDLDHFKRVNDTYGHAAGDRVLRVFADRVRATVRQGNVLVRRGGEEFVLLMPTSTTEQARVVAERIRGALADAPVEVGDGVAVRQTVSIGVATWDGCETAEDLERRADLAMYEAKSAGRDRVAVAAVPAG